MLRFTRTPTLVRVLVGAHHPHAHIVTHVRIRCELAAVDPGGHHVIGTDHSGLRKYPLFVDALQPHHFRKSPLFVVALQPHHFRTITSYANPRARLGEPEREVREAGAAAAAWLFAGSACPWDWSMSALIVGECSYGLSALVSLWRANSFGVVLLSLSPGKTMATRVASRK